MLSITSMMLIPGGIILPAHAAEIPFITTWSIDELDKSLEIPTTGTGYNYTIDWGDGVIDTAQTGNAFHTYTNAGNYIVSISGDFPRIYLYGSSSSADKLITVDQWGDIEWTSMYRAFYGAGNMNVIASDEPDLSRVTDMSYMFFQANSFNGDISNWDVSSVTSMSAMFGAAYSFNGDISNWDVSSVTSMSNMFQSATSFNGDISNWDVSSVTSMAGMLYDTDSFNGDITSWDVSSVTEMTYMFFEADSFNGDITSWDVSSVTEMNYMFYQTDSFNGDISNWDVSSVTSMLAMFNDADSFNGDISNWDVNSVTSMSSMFGGASSFNGDISNWDVSSVTSMSNMFDGADYFNGDISNWDVSNVTDMNNMFIDTSLSTNNYDKLLDVWSKLPILQNGVDFDSSSKYCDAGEIGRVILTDTYGWIITDAGKDTVGNCNTTPVLDTIQNQSVYENDLLVFLVNATDADGDVLFFEINPLLNFTSFVNNGNNTATFSANPGYSDFGVYNFNVTATDGVATDSELFTLTVNNINQTSTPIITSLVADDLDDSDDVYSIDDTITIFFDSDTNTPGGSVVQSKVAVDDLYAFTHSFGESYTGQWNTADTFVITISNTVGAAPPIIDYTAVTPAGITLILSYDETSSPSTATSPALSGDFGYTSDPLDWILGILDAIYYDAGNVGIGTDNPTEQLQVDGNFKLNGNLTSDGDICIGTCQ